MKNNQQLPHLSDYKHGIIWTLIDSLGSQGLVILYHLFFRTVAGASLHGIMGCLLSSIYLLIALTNLGLDKTIAPFLETFSASQKNFKQFVLTLIIPQVILISTCALFCYTGFYLLKETVPLLSNLSAYLTPTIVGYIALTFFFESLRKTFRTFLQLSFYFKFTTIIELFGISANLLALYLFYNANNLTLLSSWQALAYTSAAQLALLTGGMFHIYTHLSQEEKAVSLRSLLKRFTKTRLFSWALQCLNQLYSGNFLVPICALQFGIESASLMKIITSISYWITLIAKKVFGITSNALLAHVKSRSKETQTKAFHYLSDIFNQGISCVLIFLLINGKKLAYLLYEAPPQVTWSLLYFMLLLTFFESFFVLYEKWYILEEDAHTYLGFNLLSVGLVYFIARTLSSPTSILVAIIIVRALTFIVLTLFSFYRWKIWPSFKPHWRTVLGALAMSGISYVLL